MNSTHFQDPLSGYNYPYLPEQNARDITNLVPEEQWKQIQSDRAKLNPEPQLEVVVQRTKATFANFLDNLLSKDPKSEYLSAIRAAEMALKRNQAIVNNEVTELGFNDEDIDGFNRAISLVDISERAPLYSKLAHAYSLRHIPATQLADSIQQGYVKEQTSDQNNSEQAIIASREAIEAYLVKVTDLLPLVTANLNEYKLRQRKSAKVEEALQKLQGMLEVLKATYKDLHLLRGSEVILETLTQFRVLEDQKAYPDLTSRFNNYFEILSDLYYLQATEYERLATVMPEKAARRGFLDISTKIEAKQRALHTYAVAQKLLKDMDDQTLITEGRMIAKQHLKGIKNPVLNENDQEVKKLRADQHSTKGMLSAVEAALSRLKDDFYSAPANTPAPSAPPYVEPTKQPEPYYSSKYFSSPKPPLEPQPYFSPVPPPVPSAPPIEPKPYPSAPPAFEEPVQTFPKYTPIPAYYTTLENNVFKIRDLYDQAQLQIALNNPAKVLEIYKKIYSETTSREMLSALGELALENHQNQEARYFYEQILEKSPYDYKAKQKIRELNKILP